MPYRKAWEVGYRRDRAAGRARYVDAESTRVRLAELAAGHVPLRALARASGLSDAGVRAVLDGSRHHVQRATATRVAVVSLQRIYSEQATGHVPRIGAVRRVQALMAMGWSHHDLDAAGVPNTPKLLARSGHLVTVQRWREVQDVYDRLSMTPGPSLVTKGWAKRLGYAPPLAWDDASIDDPAATAHGQSPKGRGGQVIDMVAVRRTIEDRAGGLRLNADERREVVRELAAGGASDAQIGGRLGVTDRTVLRLRQREDIPPGRPVTRGGAGGLEWAEALGVTGIPSIPASSRALAASAAPPPRGATRARSLAPTLAPIGSRVSATPGARA